ncbi:hypothetical protein COU57_01010 [Candidatus Pacearchaeota archaeon CG10_big_fil_rev_8_21_14_0_10_32_14]|nr:MAG: hypothetical protein COU57_01010 [Candidatus Pacearchaeota archaeon CG10_big_fil_rev_8_21_14_0_10_32_14]
MILDSSFIIDLLKGDERALNKSKDIGKNEIIKTTTINSFEVLQGGEYARKDEKEKINRFFDNIEIIDFDFNSSKKGGKIHSDLIKNGIEIDPEDSMIAGIALIHNEKILTKNVKHFSRIKDLEIESY